jgi:hypothetical protein
MNKKTDKCFVKIDELFKDVQMEHNRQLSKWGIQCVTIFEWLNYLTEEIGELNKAAAENEYRNGSSHEVYKEAIQCATLALKIAEMYKPTGTGNIETRS